MPIRHVLAVAVAAVALAPPAADAAIGQVGVPKLRAQANAGKYDVSVTGTIKMTQREAQSLLSRGYKLIVRVWGEDAFRDDLLLGPYVVRGTPASFGSAVATPQGLTYRVAQTVSRSELNEDDDPGPGGTRDELYAGVRLVTPGGATTRSGESNRLSGHVGLGARLDISCPVNYVGPC